MTHRGFDSLHADHFMFICPKCNQSDKMMVDWGCLVCVSCNQNYAVSEFLKQNNLPEDSTVIQLLKSSSEKCS